MQIPPYKEQGLKEGTDDMLALCGDGAFLEIFHFEMFLADMEELVETMCMMVFLNLKSVKCIQAYPQASKGLM